MLACYSPSHDILSSHYQDFDNNYFSPQIPDNRIPSSLPSSPPQPYARLMSISSQQNPAIRVQKSSPFPAADQTEQQMLVQPHLSGSHWGGGDNLLSPSRFAHSGLVQQRQNVGKHHKRTSSASSAGSVGPPSPQDTTTVYPRIAGSDTSHFSPSAFDSFDFFATTRGTQVPKSLPTPVHTPTQSNFRTSDFQTFSSPHDIQTSTLMRRIPQNRSPNNDDDGSYTYSGPQSVSSVSHHDSPATPQTASYDGDFGDTKTLQNSGFNPQLGNMQHGMVTGNFEELYGSQLQNVSPQQQQQQQQQMVARGGGLSPFRTSLANRFQAAQLDHVASRASSPAHSIQRERSPFRQGSQFEQAAPMQPMQAMSRQRLGPSQMGQVQYQQHHNISQAPIMQAPRPQPQQQEQPKTVSPKDVELEYHEQDQTPLFPSSQQSQFSLPREESNFSTASNFGQPGQYYTSIPPAGHQAQQYSFLGQQTRQQSSVRGSQEQPLPDFPAHLSSMETTISSESGQESQTPMHAPRPGPVSRPRDTSADLGTYSCTFHGCSQRFDSAARLQRHKREVHGPSSPIITDANAIHSPPHQGHVSSASTIASRNAQSGPHRCERINPTTGKPCNSIFSRPYDLTRHEDTIHSGRKRKVRCHLCTEEKTFSRNDALTRHMRVVHPEVDWPGKTRRKGRD